MRFVWCCLLLVFGEGLVLGQVGFSTKTPLAGWLEAASSRHPSLALGVAGRSVWFSSDLSRWLNQPLEAQLPFQALRWWIAEDWSEAKQHANPSALLLLRAREVIARQQDNGTSWERLSAVSLHYQPTPRWSALVQIRHRDPLPLLEAYPLPTLEVAVVRGFIGSTVWEFGRNYYRWGPGYLGTPLLSDHAYPLDGITFSSRIRLPLIGRWRVRQLHAYLHGDSPSRFLIVRRWERSLSNQWQLGFTEANLSRSFPPPLTLFLPMYPVSRLYVNAGWRKEGSDQVLVNADLTYRSSNWTVYGVFLADDLKLRWWREQEQIQRKLGWMLGAQWEGERWTLGAEYAKFDRLTYTHHVQEPYWYHGIGLGYPTGADSQVVAVWGRYQPVRRLQLIGMLTRSQLERRTANKDTEHYWLLSLQWLASPQTLVALHWTKGFPPRWGVNGGWSETVERTRFLLLEVRWHTTLSWDLSEKR